MGSFTIYSVEDDINIISQKCRLVFSATDADKEFIKKLRKIMQEKGCS